MSTRHIIEIDQDKCNGCGACETGCPEGALRIIDGKARLVGESLCDGLGACLGNCPFGAITVVEREAEAYDEEKVLAGIIPQGANVIAAHLDHLRRHGQDVYVRQAETVLAVRGIPIPAAPGGCPGSMSRRFSPASATPASAAANTDAAFARNASPSSPSALSHWPIQLHLVNPRARQFENADLLIAADCTAFSLGSFHEDLLKGRSLVIACPKLDTGREIYIEKLAVMIGSAASVTVAIMEVPCCSGLLKMVLEARQRVLEHKTVNVTIVGIEGGFVARKTY